MIDNSKDPKELFDMFLKYMENRETLDIIKEDPFTDLPNEIIENLSIKKVENKTVFKGFYLNPEISEALDHIANKKKKSIKSDIVNLALKEYLNKQGIL